jgi:hypothetical protein
MTDESDTAEKKENTNECSAEQATLDSATSSTETNGNPQKAAYLQIIKSVWTHEPWKIFKVIVKSNEDMGDYIALHGLVPQNELPLHMRNKIPENEIWIRENVYNDIQRRRSILAHEYAELDIMVTKGLSYKEAHLQAEFIEHLFYPTGFEIK